jgi:hypothetical protein
MSKADEYRKLAAQCLEAAKLVSLQSDRERLAEMALRWLEMAARAEEGAHNDKFE